MSDVAIVIPYWNSPESVSQRIAELRKLFTLVIVNNASQLPSFDSSKNIRVIENSRNDGFARACNLGWRSVTNKYVLFLNPDCAIQPNQIEELVQQVQKNSLDAASPTLTDEKGQIQSNYHQPLPSFLSVVQQFSPLRHCRKFLPQVTTSLPGGCLLIARSALEEIDGWDERFWLWWEDADLSLRLQKAGLRFQTLSTITVPHLGGETFSKLSQDWRKQVFFHSLNILARKHFRMLEVHVISAITRRWSNIDMYPADPNITVTVVVPNINDKLLKSFLEKNHRHFDASKQELICVSPHSHMFRAQFPDVIFLDPGKPLGFAAAVNLGFSRARGRYLATVNDDVVLPDRWLAGLIEKGTDKVGSVMPKVVDPNGNVESFGISVLPNGKAIPNIKPTQAAETVNAAAVLFSRTALEKVGLFDERFGSYLEDVDLGLRMSKAGFKHVVVPEVTVVHHKHQTSKSIPVRKAWYDFKNWWLIVLKNWPPDMWLQYGPSILLERARNLNGLRKTVISALSRQSS